MGLEHPWEQHHSRSWCDLRELRCDPLWLLCSPSPCAGGAAVTNSDPQKLPQRPCRSPPTSPAPSPCRSSTSAAPSPLSRDLCFTSRTPGAAQPPQHHNVIRRSRNPRSAPGPHGHLSHQEQSPGPGKSPGATAPIFAHRGQPQGRHSRCHLPACGWALSLWRFLENDSPELIKEAIKATIKVQTLSCWAVTRLERGNWVSGQSGERIFQLRPLEKPRWGWNLGGSSFRMLVRTESFVLC